jgi:glycine/D-amino acid oxidase-like deaminating enzyme
MPDIESRGLKLARDTHGERVDPDTQSRLVSREGAEWARRFVARRFPAMKDAPIVETRVCQYENTSNGDFLIDRHPELSNVWLAGGGSGHGFKHGPAFGEYTAGMVLGEGMAEPRFSLATKATQQARTVH